MAELRNAKRRFPRKATVLPTATPSIHTTSKPKGSRSITLARSDERHAMRFDQFDDNNWAFNEPQKRED